ncbi:cyclic nucleotide-binding domain-containing protein [Kamptonema cortianum]|uniref:Cyclic nucleotide-binding domain-containing protein n=1 Tax=Geitlerinema calcuttense NRMC-F 0142 TaxID=2922238 RepID=A0ABT7LY25_9CYAN|nr:MULTISPECIES: cyclic nucleotide-binding domain-containing protein [Cyanophyceae]MDK3157485.1 cyclic nucleotide-binding domain-containing protein [Kamptonema cortianum]MDL5052600.1 cyclic nucleotide-binding domain-containing protein [Oscillatoria laete-virens NRMC-F 0139]MDL5056903.1 cyclic nucleotide-binding domain-containing protein [Geitlerinema calcuttense NRMC-F 0142]
MKPFVEIVASLPVRQFAPEEFLIRQQSPAGHVFILAEGTVRIIRDDIEICQIHEVGSFFGEVSSLTNQPTTASVQAVTPVKAHVIENPMQFAFDYPVAVYMMAVQLAQRLAHVDTQLTQIKRDYQEMYRRLSEISMV